MLYKCKLEAIKTNVNKSPTKPPAIQVTTYNRFSILEITEDSTNTTETVNNLHTQRIPPPPPIFIDDVIDIQTMIKSIEKDISKEDYKFKLPHIPTQARKTFSCGATQYPPLRRPRRTKVRTSNTWSRGNQHQQH